MPQKNPIKAIKKQVPRKKTPVRKKKKAQSKTSWIIAFIVLTISIIFIGLQFIKEVKPMTKATFRNSAPAGFPTMGIDVSHHQGEIDWEKLMIDNGFDSLIHFVYCKATEGQDHIDRQWSNNRKKLNDLGIPNGAYHFFSPKTAPLAQATHFLAHWSKRDIDLPPVLDVETEGNSDEELIQNMTIWLNEVEKKSGMRPVIYTSRHFYETKFQTYFPNYKFWIAAYSGKPTCIDDPRIIHWQYSESGKVPGIKEKIDLNVSKLNF